MSEPLPVFSHSQMSTYCKCPKLMEHQYEQGMRLRATPHFFLFGSAFHAWKEHYLGSGNLEEGLRAVIKVFEDSDKSTLSSEQLHNLAVQQATVQGICKAYPGFYQAQDDAQYSKYLVEQKAEIRLKGVEARYKGYIDCIAQDAAGQWWLIETKTATKPSADWIRRVHIDSQVSGYMWLAKKVLGEFPRGVIYDVVKKPALRLKQGESITAFCTRIQRDYAEHAVAKDYFTRHQVLIGKAQLKRWMQNTATIAQQIIDQRSSGGPWPMYTHSCVNDYGNGCFFLDACLSGQYDRLRYVKDERRS